MGLILDRDRLLSALWWTKTLRLLIICVQLVGAAPSNGFLGGRRDPSISTSTLDGGNITSLPQPFDSSLGNNFTTQSCPDFFNSFLSDPNFQSCLPFSLLLQTSGSFFAASRSLVRISQIMDASCSVDYPQCSSLMSKLANQVQQSWNCGQDLQYQNPLVSQAYNGFLAYDSLYQAGCLRDSQGAYCYGDAMMNQTNLSDAYVYYLPLGVQLPANARPTCSGCLSDTMAVFASGASNSTKPISKDYISAAKTINSICGSSFANAQVQISNAAASALQSSWWLTGVAVLLSVVASYP